MNRAHEDPAEDQEGHERRQGVLVRRELQHAQDPVRQGADRSYLRCRLDGPDRDHEGRCECRRRRHERGELRLDCELDAVAGLVEREAVEGLPEGAQLVVEGLGEGQEHQDGRQLERDGHGLQQEGLQNVEGGLRKGSRERAVQPEVERGQPRQPARRREGDRCRRGGQQECRDLIGERVLNLAEKRIGQVAHDQRVQRRARLEDGAEVGQRQREGARARRGDALHERGGGHDEGQVDDEVGAGRAPGRQGQRGEAAGQRRAEGEVGHASPDLPGDLARHGVLDGPADRLSELQRVHLFQGTPADLK